MRTLPLLVPVLLASVAVPARADSSASRPETWSAPGVTPARDVPAPASATPPEAEPRFALGTSSPVGWLRSSGGGSLYVGVHHHHAMRANVMYYDAESLPLVLITGGASAPRRGHLFDLGLGWVYYPRRLWEGFTIEAGALRRDRADRVSHEDVSIVKTHSTTHAGRAMIGWSWKLTQHMFLAIAAGVSVGYETGDETTSPYWFSHTEMDVTRPISRWTVAPETYLRLGLAFGR